MLGTIFLKKISGVLAPADDASEQIIAKLNRGECIRCEYTKPRNYENLKRFFAMIQTTFDMQEHFDNIGHFRKWLQMKAGAYTLIIAPNGAKIFDPDSISFSSMDEIEFQALFSNCLDAFLESFGDKISKEELERVIDFG